MEKTYQPSHVEKKHYDQWEASGAFSPQGSGEPYCILLPPPNVTGTLHMGHGFQHTLMDVLVRYHRMCGRRTLWQPGTDHAGIATQMVVERQLERESVSRHDIGREAFEQRIWQWKEASENTITQQMRRLGVSCDWSRERFTMDEGLCEAVKKVFVDLYQEGLIYRGKRLVNWDPVLLTAVSDLEVVTEEVQGSLWHMRYPLASGEGSLVVATTRPETLFGDMAVAVHPEDTRYQHWIGKMLLLPLTDRQIPVIADAHVDPDFGTGCVKVTPAHDFNDYDIGLRHDLALYNIMTATGCLNENVPADYQGLDRFDAREKVIAALTEAALLEKTEPHTLHVPKGDRSGAVIEPYLTDQWYVKMASLAEPALRAVDEGELQFVPKNWSKTYFQWLDNIQDWCISRQLWWGHRIPAWYDQEGRVYVGMDEAAVREKHQLEDECELTQDEDVLDTWFSSALWPLSALGWPQSDALMNEFIPSNVLMTGFDIIFFWVARMVMMSLKLVDQLPFDQVYITGLIRDGQGQKMSKSKGNVIDPIDVIDGISLDALLEKRTQGMMQPQRKEKVIKQTKKEFPQGIDAYGTDALRFTYCALATTNRDINFDLKRVEGYRNFCNKLWNAGRYVLMQTQGDACGFLGEDKAYGLAEQWILSLLDRTVEAVSLHWKNYRFDLAAQALYEFTWNEYCDWYLELSKPVLWDTQADEALKVGTRHTLVHVLETLLRLLHPVIPFITEEIWQQLAPQANGVEGLLMQQTFPVANEKNRDAAAEESIEWLKKVIVALRTIRSEVNISPAKQVPLLLEGGNDRDKAFLKEQSQTLSHLLKLSRIEWLEGAAPPSAQCCVGELTLHIPLKGLIDKEAEAARLKKACEKAEKRLQALEKKLSNPNYLQKAPKEVVEKEQEKAQAERTALTHLHAQYEQIQQL